MNGRQGTGAHEDVDFDLDTIPRTGRVALRALNLEGDRQLTLPFMAARPRPSIPIR
jgi:hypothetical protein